MTKISIITACYNSKDTIADAVYSVSTQTYENIEYIIIDGGSDDGTLDIINQHKDKISKLVSEPDNGIYDALNKGIKLASGDIIAFLHADDIYYDNDSIKRAMQLFDEKQTDSVYADLQYVAKDDLNKIIRHWKSGEFKISKLKKGWMPPHPTFLVKRRVYETYGLFDTNFRIAADYDIILRFLGKYKISTAYLPQVMIRMRVGGASNRSLKNIILKSKEDVKALKKTQIGGWFVVFMKNITKIPQLFTKDL